MTHTHPGRLAVLTATVAIVAAACGNATSPTDSAPPTSSASGTELTVAPASFDLAVGDDQRFLVGLFTSDRTLVLGGEVEMQLSYLGRTATDEQVEPSATVIGSFLAVPGKEPSSPLTTPTAVAPSEASGVYQTRVDFDRPGIWTVDVSVQLDDGRDLRGSGTFSVAEQHEVPAVGDTAPTVDNLTMDSDVTPSAIDSRAQGDADIPDPGLHATTVARAIAQGLPTVLVVSTPTYCVSQFCGPITDTIDDLARRYGDVAAFIHLEVWRDFDSSTLNDAAAAWIQTQAGGNEPWVFYIDGTGTIAGRWDNVLDRTALVSILDTLAAR